MFLSTFSIYHSSILELDRLKLLFLIIMRQNGSNCKCGFINLDQEWFVEIQEFQHKVRHQLFLQVD